MNNVLIKLLINYENKNNRYCGFFYLTLLYYCLVFINFKEFKMVTCIRVCNIKSCVLTVVCVSGYFGQNCSIPCNVNCNVASNCNRFTGKCNGGCKSGWTGDTCSLGKPVEFCFADLLLSFVCHLFYYSNAIEY